MSYQEVKPKLSTAFSKIGLTNGTSCPSSLDNRASIAHELYVADTLASMATKRKELAREAARSAGILGDDYAEGETKQTYDNEHLSISAKTASASKTVDKTKLMNELVKALGAVKAATVMAAVEKTNKPATSFIFAVK